MDFNSLIKDGIAIIPQGVTEIPQGAFRGCSGLTRVEIPSSVTKIGRGAFSHCRHLTSIEIPDSVTKIEDKAFFLCRELCCIDIPNSVSAIGDEVFRFCRGLTGIEIPNSVIKIGDGAFYACNLTEIAIPDSVTEIGICAFSGCSRITSIVVDSRNNTYKSQNNSILTKDGNTLILGCKNSVIPNGVIKIGNYAFRGCQGLTSIEIPDSVTEIGEGAFYDCTGLSSIAIPSSVTKIGRGAFNGCTGLTSIIIPDSVIEAGEDIFLYCYGLCDVYSNSKKPELVLDLLHKLKVDDIKKELLTRKIKGDAITLHVPIGAGYAYRHSEIKILFKAIISDYDSGNWARTGKSALNDGSILSEKSETSEIAEEGETSGSIKTSPIHYLFFDTETTGLPRDYKAPSTNTSNWPRMVQLSWISQDKDGKTIKKGNYIIRPEGFSIPTQASDIHGITTSRALREGVSLRQALNEFLEDAKQAKVLVGHNVSFDMKVLGCECVRLFGSDSIRSMKSIDTMEAATNYCAIPGYYGYKWPKLQELHRKLFGYEFDDAHDSSADIAATAKCFWEMKRRELI